MTRRPDRITLAPDLQISRLLSGLWQIADMEKDGSKLDLAALALDMKAYAEAGFDTFDMADHYGSAELIAGQFNELHRAGKVKADRPVLATKWCPMPGAMTPDVVRAAVDNQRVAGGTGIHVQRLFFLTFSLGCGLAGLGGALSLGMLGLEPSFPLKYLVYFLIVVCVGGAGTITGPFVAALLVGIVDVAGKYYLPEAGAFLIYVVMIIMLLARPNGIIPRKGLA